MAITCALQTKHIEALTRVITKAMLNSSQKGEVFNVNSFMDNLYSNLKERQGVDNAIQYMQQVPYIANRILAKLEDVELAKDVNGNEISLRTLSKNFRDDATGIDTVLGYFEKTISPESLAVIALDNANKPVQKFEYEEPEIETEVINYNDRKLKARNILSGTHEEFIAQDPSSKEAEVLEVVDKSKLSTINAIGRISIASNELTSLDNIVLDGVELKLKAIPLDKISESDRTDYSNDVIKRQNAILADGKEIKTIPAAEQIALVITDPKGAFVYFGTDGKVTTKENGGRIAYQMLRNVVFENGKYTAINIYGYDNQIISPEDEAKLRQKESGLTVKEFETEVGMSMLEYVDQVNKEQQEQLKQIYNFKQSIVRDNKTKIINLTGASRGVFNVKVVKNITLNNLDNYYPEIKENIVKSIQNLDKAYNGFGSGRTIVQINGEVIEIDRSQVNRETADKIAAVLTNPKISLNERLNFYHQFFTDEQITLPSSSQRHDLSFKDRKLVFNYVPHTRAEANSNGTLKKQNETLREVKLDSPTAAKDISDILMSGWSTKAGASAPANLVYKSSLLSGDQDFYDYVNGEFVKANYVDFLLNQNGRILIAGAKSIPLYNAYLKFNLDNTFNDQVNAAKEVVKEKEDTRSEVRKFKDDIVAELKADPSSKITGTITKVSETSVSDGTTSYTYTVKIDGKEGEHNFYQSKNKAAVGDVLSIELNPIEIKDGFGYPNNVSLTKVEGGQSKYFGNLAETDFKANEPKRTAIPMQQDYVAETLEQESLDEVQVAPKVVTEEQSDVQVSEGINPSISENPADDSVISQLIKSFNLKRSTNLPSGITKEQVQNAIDWYGPHPLSKFLGLPQMVNIVNSDAYARFIVAGSTLLAGQYTGKLGAIQINKATGGTMVDVYHEAWHAFSQLFLTRQEKIDLYNELKKSNPKYKDYSFLELEEILAEDFRSYVLNQNTKPKSPKRNTLFRRILNFLKKLFGGDTSIADDIQVYDVETQGVAGELFRNLYLASSNPNLLNKYTPSIDNVMFDILNRGITQVANKNELALNSRDSELVNESLDSVISDIVDESFKANNTKTGTTKIVTDASNRRVAYEIAKLKFEEKLKSLRSKLKVAPENPFAEFKTISDLEKNASAIIRSNTGEDQYIFLKSQIEDFNNLNLATKKGTKVKGELYEDTVEIVGDFYTHGQIKYSTEAPASIIIVDTIEEGKAQFDNYVKAKSESIESFEINPEVNASSSYDISTLQSKTLDSIRILQTAVNNWDSVVKFHEENSSYEILKEEVNVERVKEEEDAASDIQKSEKVKSEIGKETLFELGGKDVIYILRSLHKKNKQVGGEYVNEYNDLGFKKTVNFRQMWNTLVKVTNSAKSPEEIYKRIVDASNNFPELKQLIEFKLPDPSQKNTSYEFDVTTSFWSVFSLPRVPYLQLSVFKTDDGLTTEVTSGSLDTKKIVKAFRSNFKTNRSNQFVNVGDNNVAFLNLQKVVDAFSNKFGELDETKNREFLNALGINLENTEGINSEISSLKKRTYFGLPFIFDTIKELNVLNNKARKTDAEANLLLNFRIDPIKTLSAGIPANMIGAPDSKMFKEGSRQKTQIERIAELQIRYGFGITSMSSSNAEGNKVNEHTTDNSLTVIADAINSAESRTDMYAEGNPLRFLDPRNNPMAESSFVIKNLFDTSNKKSAGKRINVFLASGTQRTDAAVNNGQNTTSLSQQGKLLQEIHTMLKGGIQEVMRAGSKSSAWGWMLEGGIQLGVGKSNEPYLYADIDSFIPQSGKERGVIEKIILPYLNGETKRINTYKTNPEAKKYIGYNRKANSNGEAAGEIYNYFDKVLTNKTKAEILEKVKDPNVSLLDYLETDQTLRDKIIREVYEYFDRGANEIYSQINEAKFFDHKLLNKLSQLNTTIEQKEKILTKAYFYNSWIHNMETSILFFTGDISQLDHSKEDGHKRTSGLISNGPRIRTDLSAQIFVNDRSETGFSNSTYARTLPAGYDNFIYNGYLNTAIVEDIARDSIYMDEIRKGLTKDLKKRNPKMPDAEVSKIVERDVEKYSAKEIKEGDGQGYITFDAYRALKKLQNKWSTKQEALYQKIVRGEDVPLGDVSEFFPVYKLQNFGFVEGTVLPVSAMHKFALFPLIPNVIQGTELENLHKQMLKNNVQYLTFASGSKTGGVTANGKPDQIFEAGSKKIKPNLNLTKNTIHGAFIKEAAAVPNKAKGQVIFSTQLRKLILEGLYEFGNPTSEKSKLLADRYQGVIDFYSKIVRKELENEIGYTRDEKGTYIGKPDKFLKLIQKNLKQKDYPDHLINALKVNSDGTLNYDLSYFIDSEGIENIVMAIVDKKLVKQKVNGEALVQVASSMWNGTWDTAQGAKFSNLSGEQLEVARKKFLGTNALPFYTQNPDGSTAAMKVAISLQGDFYNLLKLNHLDGQPIKTRQRLNDMIKNEEWLAKDNNRKSITLNAVRIPVQGLNSMEFMEVYEFLDPSAGSIIIPPTEIVAKSGGDYDVDKLTTFFPNIDENGNYVTSEIANDQFFNSIKDVKDPTALIKLQKKAVQNQIIESIKSILEIEENYASLVKPNDTYILKDVADELQDSVSKRDKYAKNNGDPANISAKNKKMISPTSMLEPLYNVGKHGANMDGKGVLGIIANDNSLHPLLTSVGYKMPKKYKASKWDPKLNRFKEVGPEIYDTRIFLPANIVDGQISLSSINSQDGVNKIADIFSQAVNGSVDVEKDEWIFYIQGNLEVSSVLFYLLKAGVPVKDAIYFVSNPLVREYAERQRLAKGVFGEATGTASDKPTKTQYDSAKFVFEKYRNNFIENRLSQVSDNEDITVTVTVVNEIGRRVREDQKYKKQDLLNALPNIANSIEKIKVAKGTAYVRLQPSNAAAYETTNFLTNIPGTLKNNMFDRKDMLDIIKNKGELTPEQLSKSLAILSHFVELQKQIRGLGALKRKAKPDVQTIRTPQEVVMRELDVDLLYDNSKIDEESAKRLLNDSVVSSFGEKDIIKNIFMPMMELLDGDKITSYLTNAIKGAKINEISEAFSSGTDGVINFTKRFKGAVKSFIFQNYLSNMIDKQGNIVSIPTEYRKTPVKINNKLGTDVQIQDGQFIVNEQRIKSDYAQKTYLATNTGADSYTSREGLSAFELSNDMFSTEESYFKYVLEREYLYQKGLREDELNQIALMNVFNYAAIMLPGKYSYSDLVLRTLNKHRRALSGNYTIIDQISKVVDQQSFSALTLADKDTLTGSDNTRYATELKALGNPRIQKVADPQENMRLSRIFRLLPLIMVYQHGSGKTRYGFDLALPIDDYITVMKSAGNLFKQNYQNDKTYDIIFKRLTGIASEGDKFADNLTGPKSAFKDYVTTATEYNSPIQVAKPAEVTETPIDPEDADIDITTQPVQPIAAEPAEIAEEVVTQPTAAPVDYTEVPLVQVQPTLEPGRYVTFDGNTWIVTKQNANGTWQIYNPLLEGTDAKKSVAEKNLGIRPEIAKLVNYRGQDYLVTPNNTIISLVSNKKMNWASNDGNRIGILQLANAPVSLQNQTLPATPAGEIAGDYQFNFANGYTITTPFKLNDQQQAALLQLEAFIDNPSEFNNEIALIGYAGTGKTTIISLFDKYLRSKGKIPMYSAPTHRANAVTKFNNPKAKVVTLHKAFGLSPMVNLEDGQLSVENLESEQTRDPELKQGSTLIIDESSMITDQLYEFIENYKDAFNLKVIYLGDPAQLAPVDPKKQETSLSVALTRPAKMELTKVERTTDNPILSESTNLREGKPLSGVSDEVDGRGVEYIANVARTNQVIGQSLQEMQQSGDYLHFRMLSAKNENLKTLNNLARKTLFDVDETTQFVVGDVLMGYDNFGSKTDGTYSVYNSGDYKVSSVVEKAKTVKGPSGNIKFEGYTVILENLLDKSEDPVEIFIAKKGTINKEASERFIDAVTELATLAKTAQSSRERGMYFGMMFKLQSEVAFMEPQYNKFGRVAIKKSLDYGYAHTIHKSQGGTYNKVLILADTINNSKFDSIVKQQLKYVAVSRARDYVYVVSNSSEVAPSTGEVIAVDRSGNDIVQSTIDLSQIVKPLKTAEIKTSGDLALSDDNIIKVFKGTKVIINKTAKFDSGIYTVGGVQQVEIKYLGKAAVVGNSVVITNEETGKSFVRSKDDFAKAEGFTNWSDFEKNNPFASNFIKGTQGRFVYSVKPAGNISAETGSGQAIDPEYNPVIKAFNEKLKSSNGVLPKEFIHQDGNITRKYLLTKNNLYNLVDIETGSIYLRNINLQTGDIVSEDLPSVAVDKQRVKNFIDRVNKDIKNFKIDVVLAEKNIDVADILDAAENANTENDLDNVISKYNKNIC